MKLLLALLILSQSAHAIDTGDGSDGACNVSGGADTQITSAKKYYQCTSLNLDANLDDFNGAHAGAGGSGLVIKVQGNVTMSAGVTIDLSGADGLDGNTTAGTKLGGLAGAGGSAGGNSTSPGIDGLNGNGSGGGIKGLFVSPFGTSSYGGGGGGGSYKTQGTDSGTDGDNVGGSTPPGSGGSNGSIYGSEASFDSSFTGGSGGASGGGGLDNGTPVSGSTGGGGGGSLRIIAGGNITIDGDIISKGGKGGGSLSTSYAGGGGGGSGGAIWLQAGGALTISAGATVEALGGLKGENDAGPGFGGDGGDGRIRLDDADGVITNSGTVGPAPYSTTFSPAPLVTDTQAVSRQYASDVSCAKVSLEDQRPVNNLLNMIFGVMIAGCAHYLLSKKSKV